MTELVGGEAFIWGWMGLAVISAISLMFIDAPYGRHGREGWGPTVSARAAWVAMMRFSCARSLISAWIAGSGLAWWARTLAASMRTAGEGSSSFLRSTS